MSVVPCARAILPHELVQAASLSDMMNRLVLPGFGGPRWGGGTFMRRNLCFSVFVLFSVDIEMAAGLKSDEHRSA